MKGQIYRIISGFYNVYANGKIFQVKIAGKLKNKAKIPVVGDFVEFEENKFITNIYAAKNCLIQPKIANIDQVAIVVATVEPNYSVLLVNKLLAIIEFHNIKVIIIFSKIDLTKKRYGNEYSNDGYQVYEVNCLNKNNLKKIKNICKNRLTVFTGQTGVGKSTIIKNITAINQKTQSVSKATGQGKHTTRVTEILKKDKIKVIDTPGFSFLKMTLTKQELAISYHDFKKNAYYCKFKDCLHNKEQKCKIKEMVSAKKISLTRYNAYIKLLKEIDNG